MYIYVYWTDCVVCTQPEMKEKFAEVFATKTQQEWTEIFSSRYIIATTVDHQLYANWQTLK